MTDDPRRRHLTPEEAAELRRRARERRGYVDPPARGGASRAGDPRDRAPQPPLGRPDPRRSFDERRASRRGAAGAAGAAGAGAIGAGAAGRRERPSGRPVRDDAGYGDSRRAGAYGDPRAAGAYDDPRRAAAYDDPRRTRAPRGTRPEDPRRTGPRPTRGGPRFRFRPLRWLALLLVLVLVAGVAGAFWADGKLTRIDALGSYDGRPGSSPGTVTLLVGTDSREGLTPEQQAELATGSESDAGGKRTDTMMLVYTPKGGGDTMLVSLPRDLLVDIPDYGQNKLNAAYSYGGPQLLARTLEKQTGVRIDHYLEIGFAGFAGIVDAVDGVDVCLDQPIADPDAGIDLPAGCQTLDGPKALGFVRTRHTFAEQDLQRVRNQRMFLGALTEKALDPGTLLNPFRATKLLDSASSAVTVDKGDHVWSLAMVLRKLRGAKTVTVPYDGMADGDVGSYLVWGDSTTAFFDAMAKGKTPPMPDEDGGDATAPGSGEPDSGTGTG